MRNPTANLARLEALERRPRPIDLSQRRDPKTMTSEELQARIDEIKAKARKLTAERITSGAPAPTPSIGSVQLAARFVELQARARQLCGTRPPLRVPAPPIDELEDVDA